MRRPRIAFIDDDPALLAVMAASLRPWANSYDIQFFADTEAARADIAQHPPALCFVDLNLPGTDGIAFARDLNHSTPGTRVVLVSGVHAVHTTKRAVNEAHVFGVVDKPCAAREILSWIESALAERQPQIKSTLSIQAWQLLSMPVLIVQVDDARVIETNKAGAQLLAEGDGLRVDPHGVCRASTAHYSARLYTHIAGAARDEAKGRVTRLALPRDKGRRALGLEIKPLGRALGGEADTVVMVATELDAAISPDAEALMTLFDLSAQEAAFACVLAQGKDVETAAAACGLTRDSGRTYLKRIFAKTDVHRQAELIALLSQASRHL